MRSFTSLSKKGQLSILGPSVIALVIAATFLILGLIMIQSFSDTDVVKQSQSVSVVNETLTPDDSPGTLLSGSANPGANGFSVSNIFNHSDSAIVLTTDNYSVNADTGAIINLTSEFPIGAWLVTYSFSHGDVAYQQSNVTLVGLGAFAEFWEIIVLAIVIAIVIGLLLVAFGTGRTR